MKNLENLGDYLKKAEAALPEIEKWVAENPGLATKAILLLCVPADTLYVAALCAARHGLLANKNLDDTGLPTLTVLSVTRYAYETLEGLIPEALKTWRRDTRALGEDLAPEADARAVRNAAIEDVAALNPGKNPFQVVAETLGWTGDGSEASVKAGVERVKFAMHTAALLRL